MIELFVCYTACLKNLILNLSRNIFLRDVLPINLHNYGHKSQKEKQLPLSVTATTSTTNPIGGILQLPALPLLADLVRQLRVSNVEQSYI